MVVFANPPFQCCYFRKKCSLFRQACFERDSFPPRGWVDVPFKEFVGVEPFGSGAVMATPSAASLEAPAVCDPSVPVITSFLAES